VLHYYSILSSLLTTHSPTNTVDNAQLSSSSPGMTRTGSALAVLTHLVSVISTKSPVPKVLLLELLSAVYSDGIPSTKRVFTDPSAATTSAADAQSVNGSRAGGPRIAMSRQDRRRKTASPRSVSTRNPRSLVNESTDDFDYYETATSAPAEALTPDADLRPYDTSVVAELLDEFSRARSFVERVQGKADTYSRAFVCVQSSQAMAR
jgi:hypothetical protein